MTKTLTLTGSQIEFIQTALNSYREKLKALNTDTAKVVEGIADEIQFQLDNITVKELTTAWLASGEPANVFINDTEIRYSYNINAYVEKRFLESVK